MVLGRTILVQISKSTPLTHQDAGLYQPRVKLETPSGATGYVALRPLLDLRIHRGKSKTLVAEQTTLKLRSLSHNSSIKYKYIGCQAPSLL